MKRIVGVLVVAVACLMVGCSSNKKTFDARARGWTGDGKLRHASFKGLREDADSADVFRIEG